MTTTPTRDVAAQEALTARLADPQVAGALMSLLDHADLLALLVDGLDGFVARSEVIGESLVDGLAELRSATSAGVGASLENAKLEPAALLSAVISLAAVLPRAAPGLVSVFENDGGDHLALLTAGLSRGTADFARDPVHVGGPLTLLRVLKDPDVNRALSFLVTVARAVGRELAER
jgi:hypothetical protein